MPSNLRGAVSWVRQRLERRVRLLPLLFVAATGGYLVTVFDTTPVYHPSYQQTTPRLSDDYTRVEREVTRVGNNSWNDISISNSTSTINNNSINSTYRSATAKQRTLWETLGSEGELEQTTTPASITSALPILTTTPKSSERFKFVHDRSRFRLDGPVVNPVPGGVRFRWQPGEGNACNASGPFVLAMVPSALANRERRDWIRHTWANPKLYNHTELRAVFVVGQTLDPVLQSSVDKEAQQQGDLLQYNFIDSYRNLTYKTSSLLTWAALHCPNVTFLTKVDDDVLLNPFHLRTFLLDQLFHPPPPPKQHQQLEGVTAGRSGVGAVKPTECIYGRVETFHKPHRKGRWGLTVKEYPEPVYPAFVLGPAYIVGMEAVRRLVRYAPFTPMVTLEDVYITGLVAHAAGVPRVPASNIYDGNPTNQLFRGSKVFLTEKQESVRKYGWEGIMKYSNVKL